MKYVNSQKYMNSFPSAASLSEISQKRIRELCLALGRINIGTAGIFLPSGAAGHASASMLESVIKSAGYRVGRITGVGGYDSRAVVYIDGAIPEIDDYNRAVAELKAVAVNNPDEDYLKEEMSFVLGLLLCKMRGCEYLIFEGTSGADHSFDSVCSPYDLVVIPSVLDGDGHTTAVCCDAIRRGTREVISGNQKKDVYELISNACVSGGVRLNFTSKLGFEVESVSARSLGFSYGGRGGYTIKSPSLLLRDCAMLVIESALAIRRDGIKLPWASIASGLASATGCGCFDMISVSPLVIVDSAENASELELLIMTLEEVFGSDVSDGMTVCIPADSLALAQDSAFASCPIIAVGGCEVVQGDGISVKKNASAAACEIVSLMKKGMNVICFGDIFFAHSIKSEIVKAMGL